MRERTKLEISSILCEGTEINAGSGSETLSATEGCLSKEIKNSDHGSIKEIQILIRKLFQTTSPNGASNKQFQQP
jgi:hypothetical protein